MDVGAVTRLERAEAGQRMRAMGMGWERSLRLMLAGAGTLPALVSTVTVGGSRMRRDGARGEGGVASGEAGEWEGEERG